MAADPMAMAKAKAGVAFDLFRILDVPFYTFHDADVAPVGETLPEHLKNFATMRRRARGRRCRRPR